jgi:NAD(P)H dehydrogenase (quinone)
MLHVSIVVFFMCVLYNEGMATKKILVVYSHPREKSLNHALKDAVVLGLTESGAEVRVQDLYGEKFDPLLYDVKENDNDPVTMKMQENVAWADGYIFITPLWWANVPAMLKGYFDRVYTEGFAFEYNQAGMPVGLLENKKALLMGTCDTPPPVARLAGTVLGFKSVVKGVLKLCGIKDSTFKLFGSVLKSTPPKREKWLKQAQETARRFGAPDSAWKRFKLKVFSFIKAVRLPLFSFVFSLILMGAALGASMLKRLSWPGFLLAMLTGLMGHAAVSLSNEAADEAADKVNENRTMFNGGTGLLAKGGITRRQLTTGWITAACMALAIPGVMVLLFHYHWLLLAASALALFLGVQYSLPPFRFSRLGLGEIAAFIAYGLPMMLIGFILQTDGPKLDAVHGEFRFFILPLPVSLSVLVTLCLTQIPDTDADKTVGKRSVSVLMGPRNVMVLAASLLLLCVMVLAGFVFLGVLTIGYAMAAAVFPLVTVIVIFSNLEAYKVPAGIVMINIMGLSVTSAVLSGVIPAIYFFNHAVPWKVVR